MPRVLITPVQFRNPQATFFAPLHAAGLELVFPPDPRQASDAEVLVKLLDGIDAVIASTEPYTRDVIQRSRLRVIARTGVGYDSVDVPAATEKGIAVTITPGAVDVSVAEHTIAMILAVFRDIVGRDREVRAGKWSRTAWPRIEGKVLGLVGMGRIGKAVVPRAQGLGMTVIAHDPYPDVAYAQQHGVQMCSLDKVLASADIVSLHMPCTAETTNLIRKETLAKMKRGSVLINTGRGGLVDEPALCEALSSRHLWAAGLDVFKKEPLPTDSPLLKLDNLLVTTHTAGLDHQSEIDMPRIAAECVVNLYQGRWPEACVVNRQLGPGWKW